MTQCALIYARVSSNQQEEDGSFLTTQEARYRAFAAEHEYHIGVYTDTHTGTQYRERPGLSSAREIVRAGCSAGRWRTISAVNSPWLR